MRKVITQDTFDEWKSHPVTRELMRQLKEDREMMKEGLVNNSFDDEQEVKGRCRTIAILLELDYEEFMSHER